VKIFTFVAAFPHLFFLYKARNQVGEAPHRKFFAPLEDCVGHSLKLFDTVQKFWAPLRKISAPPGAPNWLQACPVPAFILLENGCFLDASPYTFLVLHPVT